MVYKRIRDTTQHSEARQNAAKANALCQRYLFATNGALGLSGFFDSGRQGKKLHPHLHFDKARLIDQFSALIRRYVGFAGRGPVLPSYTSYSTCGLPQVALQTLPEDLLRRLASLLDAKSLCRQIGQICALQ